MKSIVLVSLLGLCAFGAGTSAGQDDAVQSREQAERELAEATREAERAARELTRAVAVTGGQDVVVDVDVEMRDAESRLAEAARRVAELSTRRLPMLAGRSLSTELHLRPVLGVTIGTDDDPQPVAGVEILGVSPGGAADEAGLRAGDVISAINGENMSAATGGEASDRLLDFMAGVENGDELEVSYIRAGRSAQVIVEPRPAIPTVSFGDFGFPVPTATRAMPVVPRNGSGRYVLVGESGGLGDMEMVSLTEGLGRYFGTDEGVLVVRAPEDVDVYKLEDGDVILDIDGRVPGSVSHAVRILASYQSGEKLELRIMRDQRELTLELELPDNRIGALGGAAAAPGGPVDLMRGRERLVASH